MENNIKNNNVIIKDSIRKDIVSEIYKCVEISNSADDIGLGIGYIIDELINAFENSITISFYPVIEVIKILNEFLMDPSGIVLKINEIIDKIKKFSEDIQKIIQNIINWIIEQCLEKMKLFSSKSKIKFLEYLTKIGLIDIIKIILIEIDIENINKKINKIKNKIKDKINQISEEIEKSDLDENIKKILKYLYVDFNIINIIKIITIPIKFVFSILSIIIEEITKWITNVFELIKNVVNIISNPVEFVFKKIIEPFFSALFGIVGSIFNLDKNKIDEIVKFFINGIKSIEDLFNKEKLSKIITIVKDKIKNFIQETHIIESIIKFVKLFICLFKVVFAEILKPTTLLSIFLPIDINNINDVKNKITNNANPSLDIIKNNESFLILNKKIEKTYNNNNVIIYYYLFYLDKKHLDFIKAQMKAYSQNYININIFEKNKEDKENVIIENIKVSEKNIIENENNISLLFSTKKELNLNEINNYNKLMIKIIQKK